MIDENYIQFGRHWMQNIY